MRDVYHFFSLAHLIDLLERYTSRARVGCYFLFITIPTINAVFLQTIGIGMYDYVTLSCI